MNTIALKKRPPDNESKRRLGRRDPPSEFAVPRNAQNQMNQASGYHFSLCFGLT
jgi:hypothetical protein